MSDRNFVDRLLDGADVEWLALGELTKIKAGQAVNKRMIASNPGDYPVINSGREPLGYVDKWNTADDPIGVTTRGAGVGSITWQEGKYYRGNLNYSVTIEEGVSVQTRYLYHLLMEMQADIQSLCTYDGIPALNASNLKKLLVPIPCPSNPERSLEIQGEIVRILDSFTELTAELTAELTGRKKQYNYYRDQLLSFKDGEVEWKPLGWVGEVRMCKRVLKKQTSDVGEIPFFKIGTFGKEANSFISRELFEDYRSRYSYPKVGEVLISASGTIGRAVIFDGREAFFQDSNIVWLENDESKVLNKYLFYCYQIVDWHVSDGGVIKRLYNDNIKRTLIPIPFPNDPRRSLLEQARIVDILDKFDALTNSITDGLPREIELRQKQYEYYRDLLLSFPNPEEVEA
ncbi:putative type-1 restriction enzyme specificity protein MPN_089 [Crateriforma conspicua]|uniref:Putative type-1 restriction enzyme specificity protein MPN_089 n=1 Tax=Crateriforma conspicua TaxID=2527996 RepID=A0A5C6FRW4_9PLAN|nr:restriction endonuclease subunit S [Crateriforma conspicua]TWU65659.1 putative type-1 restriction enzyme specificity protein MPN_089 [Crateriforma conspicua]